MRSVKNFPSLEEFAARNPEIGRAVAAERSRFSEAFTAIEGGVCDLTRMARIAELQLHQAVGELSLSGDKYTEAPDVDATELAIFAVSKMAEMAKQFEHLYYQLFNGAVSAGTKARAA